MSKRWIINYVDSSVDVTVARYAADNDRLIITVEGLGSVALEYEGGDVRVHCYAEDKDEPVSVRFNHDDVEVDT